MYRSKYHSITCACCTCRWLYREYGFCLGAVSIHPEEASSLILGKVLTIESRGCGGEDVADPQEALMILVTVLLRNKKTMSDPQIPLAGTDGI